MPDNSDRLNELERIRGTLETLSISPLYEYRVSQAYKPVIGEGDPNARVMFIGEAPGEKEAKTGRPFVGSSGKLLDGLLSSIGLQRQDVFITNIVKDRPPNNRDPSPQEIAIYAPLLIQQIAVIRPRVIATLGRFAMNFIFEEFHMSKLGQKISDLHGKPLSASTEYGEVQVVPLYHPAVALYNINERKTLENDFLVLKDLAYSGDSKQK